MLLVFHHTIALTARGFEPRAIVYQDAPATFVDNAGLVQRS